jgi:hypothetical protein
VELAKLSIVVFAFFDLNFSVSLVDHDPRSNHVGQLIDHDGNETCQEKKAHHRDYQHAGVVCNTLKHELEQIIDVEHNHGV